MTKEILLNKLSARRKDRLQKFPDREKANQVIDDLYRLLFGANELSGTDPDTFSVQYDQVKSQLQALLLFERTKEEAEQQALRFFEQLPLIYDRLAQDAKAIWETDPAARSIEEVVAAYPGFTATFVYRVAHQLWQQGYRLLPRFFTEYAHSKTGIDIHPAAVIGHSFAIDHGTGIVVGETTHIGNRVKIYQGVTLGALNVSKEVASTKRHPTIEDDVVIYAGATILGGSTVVGAGSVIGGNVWLTYSVPSNSVVYHKSEVHIKDNNPFPEPLNFVI